MGPEGELTNETPTAPELPEQLSGVAVVIIIAVGVQTIIMLFIFAKRQIMRYTNVSCLPSIIYPYNISYHQNDELSSKKILGDFVKNLL